MPDDASHADRSDRAATTTRRDKRRSACPVACTLDVVGDRWSLLIIRDLLGGKTRYGDFLASPEKIPTNILAERLRRLEHAGIITRVPYSQRPPRDGYYLTPDGRELAQTVNALSEWGLRHIPGTHRAMPAQRETEPDTGSTA